MPKVVRVNDWDEEERPPLEDDGKKRPPPGSRKGKAPKKGKKAPPAVKTRTSSRKRSPEGEGGASGTEEEPSEASDADSHSSQSKSTSKSSSSSASTSRRAVGVPIEEITPEQMQEIAEFYEGHPMYYDVGHENHKNTKLKDWTLDKFSEQIGLSVQAIQRHFTSCRTEHFKLKNRPKSGKSGSWAAPLTSLQKFKLKAYEFLDAHHISRTQKSTCGRLAGEDEDSASEAKCAAPSESEPTTSQGAGAVSKKSKATSASDMSRTLIECLKSSAKATQDAAEKVRVAQATAADPFQAERDAWAEWMTSANNQVPAHRYRQFQLETFTTFMRFVPLMQGIQQQPQQQPPKPPPQIVQPAVPLADPYNQQPMYLQPASLKPQQQPQQFITCITPPVRQQQQQPPQQLYEQLQPPRAVSAPPVTSATYDLSSLLALPSPLRLPASKGSNITEAAWQISSPANISLNTQSPAQRSRDSSLSQLLYANERDVTNEGPEDNTAELQREKEQEYEQE